jgi:hypothetical protein
MNPNILQTNIFKSLKNLLNLKVYFVKHGGP